MAGGAHWLGAAAGRGWAAGRAQWPLWASWALVHISAPPRAHPTLHHPAEQAAFGFPQQPAVVPVKSGLLSLTATGLN